MRRTSTLFEYPATWNSSTQHISVLAKQRRRTWKHCQDGYPYVTYSNSSLWPGSELLWFQAPHVTCWPLKGTRWVLPLVQEPRFQKSVGILSLASNLELLGRFEGLGSWSQAMARAQCAFQTQSILDRILFPKQHGRSRCGAVWTLRSFVQPSRHFGRARAVRVLGSLVQPSRHFGHVRLLALWRGAHFDDQGDLAQRSWQGGLL